MNCTRSVGQRINILGRLFAKKLNDQILNTGLTGSQWSVITCLLLHGELTQAALCEQLSIEASTISKTLYSMEKAGWISRIVDKNDKREKKSVLTDKAKAYLPIWIEIVNDLNKQAIHEIPSKDMAIFDHVLDHILENLQNNI
ncbi:MAG: transcriptional regulator SlyA [Firmicutes bacterium]|nr:transcriptional regulator SlyA [Bacillota bacterium]